MNPIGIIHAEYNMDSGYVYARLITGNPIPDLAVKLLIVDMSVQRKPEITVPGFNISDIPTVTARNHSCFHMLL